MQMAKQFYHTMPASFKSSHKIEKRSELSQRIREKYPDRIPTIVEQGRNVPGVSKQKFLVPSDLTIGKFTSEIKKHMVTSPNQKEDETKAIFLFVNGHSLTRASEKISDVYARHKDTDGFVYVTYHGESTYGSQ